MENKSQSELEVSVVFTFQNGIGRRKVDSAGGEWQQGRHCGLTEARGGLTEASWEKADRGTGGVGDC